MTANKAVPERRDRDDRTFADSSRSQPTRPPTSPARGVGDAAREKFEQFGVHAAARVCRGEPQVPHRAGGRRATLPDARDDVAMSEWLRLGTSARSIARRFVMDIRVASNEFVEGARPDYARTAGGHL